MGRKPKQEQTLEEMFTGLEEIISNMEQEQLPLEEAFELYRKGLDMLKSCGEKIDTVEKQMLVINENGDLDEFE